MKEISKIQIFLCENIQCSETGFAGKYIRGFKGFAKPPRCPKCTVISETVQNIGCLTKTKTKGHPKYA